MAIESLECRRLASVSYVRVGVKVQPNIHNEKVVFFSGNLPAGNYLIAVAGGSMTYNDGLTPVVYQVNDYNLGDFGFKVVQPDWPSFNAPGLSIPKNSSETAAADSVGVFIKFRHSTSGKIGVQLQDIPLQDNAIGVDGSPVFILKQRRVSKPATASTAAPAMAALRSNPFSIVPFTAGRLDLNSSPPDKLDSFT